MNYTLSYIHKLFEEFFSSHSQVNHFHYGTIEDYIASKEEKDFVSVNVEYSGTQFDDTFSTHNYSISISDLFNQNYPEMEHSVISNTAQIMKDFLSFLRDMDFTFTSGNIQPFREETNDFTAGVVMVLGIQVANQLNECSIPGYAQFLNSSSFAPVDRIRPNIKVTADYAISSSYALTASYALNGGGSVIIDTGSLFKNGGNSFGSSASIGTNDTNLLEFKTNNLNRITLFSDGNVSIATGSNAGFRFDVNGQGRFISGLVLGIQNTSNASLTIHRSTGTAAFVFDGSTGQVRTSGFTTWEPYNSGNASHQFNIGHNTVGFFRWSRGATNMLSDAGQLMYLGRDGRLLLSTNIVSGVSQPSSSAILELASTGSGFLPPRMTQSQRESIVSPAIGLMVFQLNNTEGTYQYTSTGWKQLAYV